MNGSNSATNSPRLAAKLIVITQHDLQNFLAAPATSYNNNFHRPTSILAQPIMGTPQVV